MPDQSEIWQHIKSGGLYTVLDDNALLEADCTRAVIYRSLFDGQVWARSHVEFHDGRFRNLSVEEVADVTPKD